MSKQVAQRPSNFVKSDEIAVDTSTAPWMDIARAELDKKVHELAAQDSFVTQMRATLNFEAQVRSTEQQLAALGAKYSGSAEALDPARYRLLNKDLSNAAHQVLGNIEAAQLREKNPEVVKYLGTVKTDPSYDKKGRSFALQPTYESKGRGQITAWCAAFVNWCLSEAGAPTLGYATAKSWLEFGTPVIHPVPGCIAVTKSSASTGSTTGHVAFFVRDQGASVILLGGNQGDAVTEAPFKRSTVLGYRWPTRFNHYLAASSGIPA